MKSAIAALALGAAGANAFVTPNAIVGRVATKSSRQVCSITCLVSLDSGTFHELNILRSKGRLVLHLQAPQLASSLVRMSYGSSALNKPQRAFSVRLAWSALHAVTDEMCS